MQNADGTGLHLVMNTGSGFKITRAGEDVLDGFAKFGDVIQPGSAVAAKLIQIADTSKGLKLNQKLRKLHEKAGGDPLAGFEERPAKGQLQLPAGELPAAPTLSQSILWTDKKHPTKVMVGFVPASSRRYAIDRIGKKYRWFCTSDGASSLHDFEELVEAQAGAQGAEYEWVKAQGGKPAGTTSSELRKLEDPRSKVLGDVKPPAATLEDQMAQQLGGFVSKGQAALKAVDAATLAAVPFPEEESTYLRLEVLVPSPKNPRKLFKDIEPLAASIKATGGLLQAIIVRPWPANQKHAHALGEKVYEIVAGERRYRALQLLAKANDRIADKVKVEIRRDLTDAQLTEAMLAENKHASLLPIEEGEGYQHMLDTGHTVETIAEKLGVSTGTVRGRLQLLKLSEKARRLLLADKMPSSVATVLARYPVELQDEALQRIDDGEDVRDEHFNAVPLLDFETGEINARHAITWLQENFTKSLKSTPFDQKAEDLVVDQSIWPDRPLVGDEQVCAPACAGCPRNSKNMPKELAGEDPRGEKRFGFCTLPTCFDAKRDATAEKLEAKAKEEGLKLLTSQQTHKLFGERDTGSMPMNTPFVKADEIAPADPKKRTNRQVLDSTLPVGTAVPKDFPALHVALTPNAGRIDLFKSTELYEYLAEAGVAWAKDAKKAEVRKKAAKTAKKPRAGGTSAEAQSKAEAREKARSRVRETVYRKIVEHYRKGIDAHAIRAMIERWDGVGPVELEELFGFETRKEFLQFLEKKATMADLFAALYANTMGEDFMGTWRSQGYEDEIERAAKLVKVDTKKLEEHELQALAAEREASEKAEKITWVKKGMRTEGKGKSGTKYVIKESKATSLEAKKKGLKTWFSADWSSTTGGFTGVGAGSSQPHDTLEIAKAACYSREERAS